MAHLHLHLLSVDFPIYQGSSRSLKKSVLAASSQGNLARDAFDRVTVRALSDITLSLEEGDRVALIGANGAGKTTLLKVLSGIYEPSHGSIHGEGRLSALIDTAVGLNPDATGYENITLRGMYMGIRPREMSRHIDRIAAFAELGGYLAMPVRTYSAGMMLNLAFAIATSIQPEILIMDEWLAVGDARFMGRAQARMEEIIRRSSILVLASHSMKLLSQWCTLGVYLRQGRIHAAGELKEVIAIYERMTAEDEAGSP